MEFVTGLLLAVVVALGISNRAWAAEEEATATIGMDGDSTPVVTESPREPSWP